KDRGDRKDRNERVERSSDRGDRKDAPRTGSRSGGGEEGMTTYFINLGKGDDLEKGELLKIICDSSGLRSRFVGRIQMFNQHSLFDVKEDKSKGLEAGFNGLQFKGRRIKVNPDKPA
ncbi:MAG: DbpA RNA binding domain-containing protein, partial [Salibacteraceae bacterium]|nr:DbpA RNA binding domain-containing protein [Salibacteraceae bacterium]